MRGISLPKILDYNLGSLYMKLTKICNFSSADKSAISYSKKLTNLTNWKCLRLQIIYKNSSPKTAPHIWEPLKVIFHTYRFGRTPFCIYGFYQNKPVYPILAIKETYPFIYLLYLLLSQSIKASRQTIFMIHLLFSYLTKFSK